MNDAKESTRPVQVLATKHRLAIETNRMPEEILKMFYENHWFSRQLRIAAAQSVKKTASPLISSADVRQEALLRLTHQLSEDATLGYRPDRGDFGAFMGTVIRRCCQFGRRKLQRNHPDVIDQSIELMEIPERLQIEPWLDLKELTEQLDEPLRLVLEMTLEGWSASEIADATGRSRRTISRQLSKSVEQLRKKVAQSQWGNSGDLPPGSRRPKPR